MLQLGLVLDGQSTLRMSRFARAEEKGRTEKDVWDGDLWDQDHLEDLPLDVGTAFLASPFCFEHGVRYEGCAPWEGDDPAITLQFRFALPPDIGFEINWLRNGVMREVAAVIAGALKVASDAGYIRLPTLGEVQVAEAQLRKASASQEGRDRATAKR